MDGVTLGAEGLSICGPVVVRRAIACAILLDERDVSRRGGDRQLGSVVLREHQLTAIARIRAAIDEFGGAILCDPVGTGKTYVALGVAPAASRLLVVGPAVLREMWMEAAQASRRSIEFRSFESLSRGNAACGSHDFLIVDEAHHARNPATRRFRLLSALAGTQPVLLMSATPIHNRQHDARVLLSLFLGVRASTLTRAELGRCILRRARDPSDGPSLPAVERLRWCTIGGDDSLPDLILELPPPLPARDGGDGGVLIAHSLIRQWCSSVAAMNGGITRRIRKCVALESALKEGTYPTTTELRSWYGAEDSVQLAFAPLVASSYQNVGELMMVLTAHRYALSRLRDIGRCDNADAMRAGVLRDVRRWHDGCPIVAFSQYADTVDEMFRRLAPDGQVAALTGSCARVAGGTLSRTETLDRFAPVASGRRPPAACDTISLLLTTDLLSEGVNLQDAGVIVHLDLPWTPARMEQRLGRIVRIGSSHQRVYAYAMKPPASAESVLRIERILRDKMNAAGIIVSEFESLIGPGVEVDHRRNNPRTVESIRRIAREWSTGAATLSSGDLPAATVDSDLDGFFAACIVRGQPSLISCIDGHVTDDPHAALSCLKRCKALASSATVPEYHAALQTLGAFVDAREALSGTASPTLETAARRRLLRAISHAAAQARPHLRARVAQLAHEARSAVAAFTLGIHAEHELDAVANVPDRDAGWLQTVIDVCSRRARVRRSSDGDHHVVALMLLKRHRT